MRIAATLVFALALAACGGPPSDTAQDDEIQGGKKDAGHPAVGLVWISTGGFCTGTLIAPQVVLTAAHCVADKVSVFYTGTGTASTNVAEPTDLTAHAVDKQAQYPSYKGGACPNASGDVGLIHLTAPLKGITPLALATAAPAAGATCIAVGYGTHNTSSTVETYGQKRSATEKVQASAAQYLTVDKGTGIADHGDSGGPLVCGSSIAGAVSCHADGSYPAHNQEYYARVDAFRPWIAQVLASWK